jgi:hypothetical protein
MKRAFTNSCCCYSDNSGRRAGSNHAYGCRNTHRPDKPTEWSITSFQLHRPTSEQLGNNTVVVANLKELTDEIFSGSYERLSFSVSPLILYGYLKFSPWLILKANGLTV